MPHRPTAFGSPASYSACLAYKPQFGLLIPLVLPRQRTLACGRGGRGNRRRARALAVTLAFGAEVWRAFLASTGNFTRTVVLEQGGTGWFKIQSVFSWVRMWGGGVTLAYVLQGAVTFAVAATLAWLWRSRAAFACKAAALAHRLVCWRRLTASITI